jgi:hypothetical protein
MPATHWSARCSHCAPPAATERQPARPRARRLQLAGALSHRGLTVRRLVAVDDALAYGLVELAAGSLQLAQGPFLLTSGNRLTEPANRSLQGRLDGLVAQSRLLVGPDPLQLRLDVGHALPSISLRQEVPSRGTVDDRNSCSEGPDQSPRWT